MIDLNKFNYCDNIVHLPKKGDFSWFRAFVRLRFCDEDRKRTLIVMCEVNNRNAIKVNDIDWDKDVKIRKDMKHTLVREYHENDVKDEGVFKFKNNCNKECEWDDEFWQNMEKKLKDENCFETLRRAVKQKSKELYGDE